MASNLVYTRIMGEFILEDITTITIIVAFGIGIGIFIKYFIK